MALNVVLLFTLNLATVKSDKFKEARYFSIIYLNPQ